MNTRLIAFAGLIIASIVNAQDTLPAPWKHQDIGLADVAGKAKHVDGVFTLQGAMDLWGTADGCHLAWQTSHGDVTLIARVVSMDNPGKVAHAKASLLMRESLDAGARGVCLCVTPGDGTQFIDRDAADGKAARVKLDEAVAKPGVGKGQFPCWLKLVRHGGDLSGYESGDGEAWTLTGTIKLALKSDLIIGLAASSHTKDTLTTAVFDQVKVTDTRP